MFLELISRTLSFRPGLFISRKTFSTILQEKSDKFRILTIMSNSHSPIASSASDAASVNWPKSHAGHFKLERYWAAAMIPLIPIAYFVHGSIMDYVLTVAVVMHIHWGFYAVVQDYARPFVIGETLALIARYAVTIVSILFFAAMLHFNHHDVGLTKAFEMVWSI